MHSSRALWILIAAMALTGIFICGYTVGVQQPAMSPQNAGYQAGYDAAKKIIDDAHIFQPAPTSTMT